MVFIAALLFFLGIEAWKFAKRVFFRRRARQMGTAPQHSDESEQSDAEKGQREGEEVVGGDTEKRQ